MVLVQGVGEMELDFVTNDERSQDADCTARHNNPVTASMNNLPQAQVVPYTHGPVCVVRPRRRIRIRGPLVAPDAQPSFPLSPQIPPHCRYQADFFYDI